VASNFEKPLEWLVCMKVNVNPWLYHYD